MLRAYKQFTDDLRGWNLVPGKTFRMLWDARSGRQLSEGMTVLIKALAADGCGFALRRLFSRTPAEKAVLEIIGTRGALPPAVSVAEVAASVRGGVVG